MKRLISFAIIVGAAGLLVYYGGQAARVAKEWFNKFSITISKVGTPSLQSNQLFLPLSIRILNPAPVAFSVENIAVNLFLMRNAVWEQIATVPQTGKFTFQPGNNDLNVSPVVDISKLKTLVNSGLTTLAADFIGGIRLRIDTIITVLGYDYTDTSYQDIRLSTLTNLI